MTTATATALAYKIISGIIDIFVSTGGPVPEIYGITAEEALEVADILDEFRDRCADYSKKLLQEETI